MANKEHLDVLRQGTNVWNDWRNKYRSVQVDLSGADLIEANLSGAVLERARLSSQSQLQNLAFQLSDEQLFSILFEDEIAFAKAGRAEGNNEEPILRLIIGGETPWTFLDMAGLLLAIQVSYNNMHYLITTEDLDIEHIRAQLTDFRRLVGVEDNIKVQSIRSGSLIVD
jgi:pentapeptide repeat protein